MDTLAKLRSVFLSSFALIIGAQLLAEPANAAIRPPQRLPVYRLHIAFDFPHGKILGRATILAPWGMKLAIDPGELKIRSLTHNGKKVAGLQSGEEIVLQAAGPIDLAYEMDLKTTGDNIIDERSILLQDNWYPSLKGFSRIRLTATLPKGYIAVSEAHRITQTGKGGTKNSPSISRTPCMISAASVLSPPAGLKFHRARITISNFAPISSRKKPIWPPAIWSASSLP
jgi:hypothetical protein